MKISFGRPCDPFHFFSSLYSIATESPQQARPTVTYMTESVVVLTVNSLRSHTHLMYALYLIYILSL